VGVAAEAAAAEAVKEAELAAREAKMKVASNSNASRVATLEPNAPVVDISGSSRASPTAETAARQMDALDRKFQDYLQA